MLNYGPARNNRVIIPAPAGQSWSPVVARCVPEFLTNCFFAINSMRRHAHYWTRKVNSMPSSSVSPACVAVWTDPPCSPSDDFICITSFIWSRVAQPHLRWGTSKGCRKQLCYQLSSVFIPDALPFQRFTAGQSPDLKLVTIKPNRAVPHHPFLGCLRDAGGLHRIRALFSL